MLFSIKSTQRHFSHIRFIFLLIIVLNTLDTIHHVTKPQHLHTKLFERDLQYCTDCFQTQIQYCFKLFQQIKPYEELSLRQLLTLLPGTSCKRNNHVIKIKNLKEKLISKYIINKKGVSTTVLDIFQLKRQFIQQIEKGEGMQYYPVKSVHEFIQNLQKFHLDLQKLTIWLYLIINIQPLILPLLYEKGFPVPKTQAVCGFTLYQHYVGEDLHQFYKMDFNIKLKIAKQLLEAALKFSYGYDNYRLYITDLTADNMVYDKFINKLYFIDWDTVFIVDSSNVEYKSGIHKHRPIECSGCFAYASEDIASHNISDINIYSSCQFLREDLFKQETKGFLYPIPEEVSIKHPNLRQLLNKCVDCPDTSCMERFTVAKDLVKLFQEILQYL